MAAKFVVAHRVDTNNVGDMASNPLQYFLKQDEYEVLDVANMGRVSYNVLLPMIVGGGGLIGNEFMGDFFEQIFDSPDRNQLQRMYTESWSLSNLNYKELHQKFHEKYQSLISEYLDQLVPVSAPRFLWGAGYNGAGDIDFEKIRWPRTFANFKLVGIRDYNITSKFTWTPCASCMHSAFDKKYAIKNDVIFFEHKKQLIKDFGRDSVPRFINSGNNFEQTIELLGSANVILTNSYHGVYWGTLLRKKVILVGGAWSSKFKFMKHQPVILGKKDYWRDCVDSAQIYDNALEECRNATKEHWSLILKNI